ncbi:MAG TPA: hypothetical protein VGI13_07825 [Candidatus Acidoferrum sp.]
MPKEKDWPQKDCEVFGIVLRDKIPGKPGGRDGAAEPAENEDEADQNARSQFYFATLAAQTIEEHAPAQVGNRSELSWNLWTRHLVWPQFSHTCGLDPRQA